MEFTFRHFESKDFSSVLDFYNKYGKASPVTERMWKRMVLLDPNFDPQWFLIAEKDGALAGMIYVIRRRVPIDTGGALEEDKAWINAFAILPEFVDELGPELIRKAEALAFGTGAETLTATSYTPNYFTQGIDMVHFPAYGRVFEAMGWSLVENSNSMCRSLKDYQMSTRSKEEKEMLAKEGIWFSILTSDKLLSLWEYMGQYSTPGWTCRLRKLLMDDNSYERVHIALDGEKVIGFNIYGDPDGDIHRFGPYSVCPDYRGKGIGRVLLEECLLDMKRAGLDYAWFQWASGDVAPILYKKVGFEVSGEYNTYRKTKEQGVV